MSENQNTSYDLQQEPLGEDNLFVGHGPTSTQPGKLIHSTNMSAPYRDEQSQRPQDNYEGELRFADDPQERNTAVFDELVADCMTERQFNALRDLTILPKDIRDSDPAYQNLLKDVTENMVHALKEHDAGYEPVNETNGLSEESLEDVPYKRRQEITHSALGNASEHYEELELRANYEPMSAADDTHPPLDAIEIEELRAYKAQIREETARYFDVDPHRGNEEPDLSERQVPALQDALSPEEVSIGRSGQIRRYWADLDTEEERIELMELEAQQEERELYNKNPDLFEEVPALTESEQQRMEELTKRVAEFHHDAQEDKVREQEFIADLKANLKREGFDLDALEEQHLTNEYGMEDDFGR
ncbi:MAG: hypothetical protein OSB62_04680 [Alphaproteobacteria bacterium]|nr:hypothetical protein [Alphaproteobacteria bacterium]